MKPEWLNAFGKMTYGIYVLTTAAEGKINGMIASWVSQISYEPPLVTVAVHPNRYSHQMIYQGKCFALHVLGKDRQDFIKRFKGPDSEAKFANLEWRKGRTGCPLLNDCIAWFECKVLNSFDPGNHTVFVAEVVDAKMASAKPALSTADYAGVYTGKT